MPGAKEPIDSLHLSQQSGGDSQLESELLMLFSKQCVDQIAVMTDLTCDVPKRRDAAHTLKGAALAVGAWHVAKAADEVEAGLRKASDISLENVTVAADEARSFIASLAGLAGLHSVI